MQKQITYIQTNLLVRICWLFFFTLLNQFYLISKNIYQYMCIGKHIMIKYSKSWLNYIFIHPIPFNEIYWWHPFSPLFAIFVYKSSFVFFWSKDLIFKLEFVLWTYYNTGINLFSYKFNYIQTNASTKWVSILDKE